MYMFILCTYMQHDGTRLVGKLLCSSNVKSQLTQTNLRHIYTHIQLQYCCIEIVNTVCVMERSSWVYLNRNCLVMHRYPRLPTRPCGSCNSRVMGMYAWVNSARCVMQCRSVYRQRWNDLMPVHDRKILCDKERARFRNPHVQELCQAPTHAAIFILYKHVVIYFYLCT